MRRILLLPAAVVASALVLGCGDRQQPPTAPADVPTPSLRAERQPFFGFFQMGGDPEFPFAIQIGFEAGVTAEDICTDPESQPVATEGQKGQFVLTPPGGFIAHSSGRDMFMIVYEFAEGPVTGPCDLAGAPVVGTGTGKFTFMVIETGPGATVFHVTVKGTIDLVSGGEARVHGTAQVTILPDGTLLFDEERVRLTPL